MSGRVQVPATDQGPDSREQVRTEGKRNKRHTKNHIHKNSNETK
jgi:hypothetical protein